MVYSKFRHVCHIHVFDANHVIERHVGYDSLFDCAGHLERGVVVSCPSEPTAYRRGATRGRSQSKDKRGIMLHLYIQQTICIYL